MNSNVLGVAHIDNDTFIKYVWWYDILSQTIEGSELTNKIRGHASFKKPDDNDPRWMKGRVILFCDKYYLMIHTVGYKAHPVFVVSKITEILGKKFPIDYVINESGELLQTV